MCTPLQLNCLIGLCFFITEKYFFLDVKAVNDIWSFKTYPLLYKSFKIAYGKISGMIYVDFVIYVDNETPSESKFRQDGKVKHEKKKL
jgi:hypothetical protein